MNDNRLLDQDIRNQNQNNRGVNNNQPQGYNYQSDAYQQYQYREYQLDGQNQQQNYQHQRPFDQINLANQNQYEPLGDNNAPLDPDQMRNIQLRKQLNQLMMEIIVTLMVIVVVAIWVISNSGSYCSQEVLTWIAVFIGDFIVDLILAMLSYHLMKKNRKENVIVLLLRFLLLIFLTAWLIYGHVLYYKQQKANDCDNSIRVLMFLILICGYYEMLKCCCYGMVCCIFVPLFFFYSRRAQRPNWMPAAPQFVQNLYQTRFNPRQDDTQDTCSICLLEFQENDEIVALPCNEKHIFHPDCIKQWLNANNSCPLCKTPITQQALEEQQKRVHRRSIRN